MQFLIIYGLVIRVDFKSLIAHMFFAWIFFHCTTVPIIFTDVKITLVQLTIKLSFYGVLHIIFIFSNTTISWPTKSDK